MVTSISQEQGKDGAKDHIFATTDKAKGTLKELSDTEGYETFVVPDDVGGRFSVLTAVGLLPIAVAGCDIDKLMEGAAKAQSDLMADYAENDCYKYAAIRNILNRKGKQVEMLVAYDPAFAMMNEWYKQLFGESEGKDNKGLLPTSVVFSTDLHSMGQFIQQGSRLMFETVVDIKQPKQDFFLEKDEANLDGLNFLCGQNMSVVNRKAQEGTILAHTEGGVPQVILELEDTKEFSLGYLIYFFEKACAVSGYVLGVNPFNQPGVESYKSNMFALLGKPGYEGARAALEAKLG
ncbi:MAG: glucose-6-phosphate isomerase [Lachnospiraceae bacterium]|nr:glucose-6-phosphate isomerase [Lachnospiraceae bacterium]